MVQTSGEKEEGSDFLFTGFQYAPLHLEIETL